LGTKTGNRYIFEQAGIQYPAGVPHPVADAQLTNEDGFLIREEALVSAMARQIERAGFVAEWVVKLNEGVAGRGNAMLKLDSSLKDLPGKPLEEAIQQALHSQLEPFDKTMSAEDFLAKIPETGVIAEVFVKGEWPVSPSYQGFINHQGQVTTVSTHEQVLDGQTYKGCKYPAGDEFRDQMIHEGEKIGQALAEAGARGHYGVDFLATAAPGDAPELFAIEINLRNTGTSYPFTTVTRLTEGAPAANGNGIVTQKGNIRFYSASDYLITENLKGVAPASVISAIRKSPIHWDSEQEQGVVFHLFGLVESTGRLGATAIADSPEAAEALLEKTEAILAEIGEAETASVAPEQWV
jgi:hypothetical protein